jgi:endonuclease/exonuclease/phosphatase family metal-dependent hydrolase
VEGWCDVICSPLDLGDDVVPGFAAGEPPQRSEHHHPGSTGPGPAVSRSYAAPVDVRAGTTLRLAGVNAASALDRVSWTVDAERLGRAVADLGADVVALQEVDHLLPRTGGVDQAAVIARECAGTGPPWQHRFVATVHGTPGDPRTFSAAAATRPQVPSYGIALLTRWPVEEWHEVRLPGGRARLPVPLPPGSPRRLLWAPDEQRAAVAAVLATPGGRVSVVCTHLSFSPLQAVRQLRRVVDWSAALPRPLVLLGDLNLPGPLPGRVTGWRPLVRAATYPARRPRFQLDHVLADGGVRVRTAGTSRVAGSDHRALVVELALEG